MGYRGSTKEFPLITVYLRDYSGTVQTADPGQTPENAAPDQGLPYTRNPFNKDKWTRPITKDGRVSPLLDGLNFEEENTYSSGKF